MHYVQHPMIIMIRYDTIRYETIRYDTIRYETRRDETRRCDAIRCDAMRCDAMRCDTIRYDKRRDDVMRCDTMRCDAMRCDTIRYMIVINVVVCTMICDSVAGSCRDSSAIDFIDEIGLYGATECESRSTPLKKSRSPCRYSTNIETIIRHYKIIRVAQCEVPCLKTR